MTNALAALQIVLLLGVVAVNVMAVRAARAARAEETQFLQDMIAKIDASNLRMMKALKGDHYAGELFGVDVFTDTGIPPDMMVILTKKEDDGER